VLVRTTTSVAFPHSCVAGILQSVYPLLITVSSSRGGDLVVAEARPLVPVSDEGLAAGAHDVLRYSATLTGIIGWPWVA